MASIYEARRQNARRIGEMIKSYLDRGYLVFDETGSPVLDVTLEGFDGKSGLTIEGRVFFQDDVDCDNGMHDTIAAFNESFQKWTFVHPKDVKPLLGSRRAKKAAIEKEFRL